MCKSFCVYRLVCVKASVCKSCSVWVCVCLCVCMCKHFSLRVSVFASLSAYLYVCIFHIFNNLLYSIHCLSLATKTLTSSHLLIVILTLTHNEHFHMILSNILTNIFMQVFGVCKSYNYITHLSTYTPTRSRANRRLVFTQRKNTQRRFYTQKPLHREGFIQSSFYTDAFTYRSFYTEKPFLKKPYHMKPLHEQLYTQTLFCKEVFTHRNLNTQMPKLLHTGAFAHTRLTKRSF